MNDIVERIRSLRYVHVPVASQLFEEACAEIERLRQVVEQKNLTAAEREALAYCLGAGGPNVVHATLRSLLSRLSPPAT